MGRMQAGEFAELVQDGSIGLRAALTWHLQSNHYPPHPSFMTDCLMEALEKYGTDDDQIYLKRDYGISHRQGDVISAATIIESLHAWEFVSDE